MLIRWILGAVLAMSLAGATASSARAQLPAPSAPDIPPELTISNPVGQPVITPDQAWAVAYVIWTLREAGRAQRDPTWTSRLETGAAAELDAYWMRHDTTSAVAGKPPRIAGNLSVAVLRQYQFPAFFVAHLDWSSASTGTDRYSEFLVITRSSVGEPWRLAVEAPTDNYDLEGLVIPRPGADGYALPGHPLGMPADRIPRLMAQYWQQWTTDQRAPSESPVLNTEDTLARGQALANAAAITGALGGDTRLQIPEPLARGGVFEIDNPSGFDLVCFSMRYAQEVSGSWWRPVSFRRTLADEPHPVASLRVTTPVLEQDCVAAYALDSNAPIILIAEQVSDEPRTIVPATPPWLPIGAAGILIVGLVTGLILTLRQGSPGAIPALPEPFRNLGIAARIRTAGLFLASGLVFAQIEVILFLYIPFLAIAVAVLTAGWLGLRLALGRRPVTVRASGEIPASRDDVFAYVTDFQNHLVWSSELEAVQPLSEAPVGVGSRYRFRQRLPDSRLVEFETTVVDYQPGWRFATVLDDGIHHQTTTYELLVVPTGTAFTSSISIRTGPLAAVAINDFRSPLQRQHMKARRAASLARLRAIFADPNRSAPAARPDEVRVPGWSLLKATLVVSLLTALVTLNHWSPVMYLCWVLEGVFIDLCIHEFAHFFVARSQGNRPDLPLVLSGLGAAVHLHPRPPTGVANARISAAGPLADALAVSVSLVLYGLWSWPGFLWYALGAGAVAVVGFNPWMGADGSKVLGVAARWLAPAGLLLGTGIYVVLLVLGIPSPLLCGAAVIAVGTSLTAFVGVPYWQTSSPRTGLTLGLGWVTVWLYLGLVAAVGFNWTARLGLFSLPFVS